MSATAHQPSQNAIDPREPSLASETAYITRPEGRVAYDVAGKGPLLVLVPGMGDLRGSYRFLAPALRQAGYRVACTDLRGHGDSDTTFASYGDEETAGDVIALIKQLGEPAILIGNSMGAGASVLVAAERPELIRGLVLIGPFVRNGQTSRLQRLALRAAMARPWAAITWKAYLPKLYAGQRPEISIDIATELVASLRRPGYAKAFSLTTRTDHTQAEAAPHRRLNPDAGGDGGTGPRLPRPARRSRMDRARAQRRRRHRARGRALPPIPAARDHHHRGPAVPADGVDRSVTGPLP